MKQLNKNRYNFFHTFQVIFKKLFILFSQIWSGSKNLFLSFSIRKKLSIILVLIVIFVITILTVIFQQSEKHLLKSKLQDICNLSVKYLSYDIKDKLLLKKYEEVTERVLSIKQQEIEGLDYAWVINKEGEYIAHTNINYTLSKKNFVSPDLKEYLFKLEDIGTLETETHYEFYYPIFFTLPEKQKNKEFQKKVIGVAGIGFSKDVILMPIRDAQKIILTIALFVTIISILGIYFLSQQMVKQIHALSDGAKKVGQGNLNVNISVSSRDELGQLAQEFNNMIILLKEKLHMQKFVSQMTRQMIKKNIISSDINIHGEQKEVAVLFADVRNFSRFSQQYQHKPQFVIDLINIYLDLQAPIIEQHFGIVDKFIGDQIMGVFEGKQRTDNAIKTAVAIQKAIRQLNAKRQKANMETLTVGIGLNSGTAVVGNIGSKDRKDYTVVGDVVNLASHFCDVAKPGQIITSIESFNQSSGFYPSIKLDPIPVKGRSHPIEICEIDYLREIIM